MHAGARNCALRNKRKRGEGMQQVLCVSGMLQVLCVSGMLHVLGVQPVPCVLQCLACCSALRAAVPCVLHCLACCQKVP